MINKYEEIKKLIDESTNIVVLSGAGVSVPSGIPDFRSRNGLYSQEENIEQLLSRDFFIKNRTAFWKEYKRIFFEKIIKEDFQPNAAHELFSFLKTQNKNVKVITQNVDGLYLKTKHLTKDDIVEVHGNIEYLTCVECGRKHKTADKIHEDIPRCLTKTYGDDVCNGLLDVDVVLFGDTVKDFLYAKELVSQADLVFVMGTSLQVEPFASLLTNNRKRKNVLLNFTNIHKRPFRIKLLQDVELSSRKILELYENKKEED